MGFMDGFTSDGTVDMKHTEYYNLMKEAAKAELLSNAVKAEVPGFYIQAMITGEKPEFLNELKAEEEDTGFHAEYEQITGAVVSIFEAWTEENGVESAAASLHRLIDTLEINRIDELRTIKGNQEEYRKKLEAAFEEMKNTMEAMVKMPPINICLNFGSKKGQAAAGKPEEGKPQSRDCWSCRTCGNTKPVRMDVDKCRECEDGSQYTEADTPDRLMTGVEFERTPDGELLDRVMDLKIMCRARPMDKERLVKLLQRKGQVVAVTGDGTNDAPALNAAQVGLSMGDGTTVAKEASAITILDNSFMSISRAVMWGRSLYRNIQRFIVFQMTINVAACLIVLIGAFLGTESPLTVTQMLWVNLIMDTFAALALASLPPDERVMRDPPRKTTDHIITRPMGRDILGVGILFVAFLFGLLQYFKHADITSLTQFSVSGYLGSYLDFSSPEHALTPYELSLFFTVFVLLQFWNMFNAKAFNTHRSAFARMGASIGGFGLVALLILAGQYLIVTFGGKMFNVVPLSWTDWGLILAGTSIVLWIGEFIRMLGSPNHKS